MPHDTVLTDSVDRRTMGLAAGIARLLRMRYRIESEDKATAELG